MSTVRFGGPRKTYKKRKTWKPKSTKGKIQKLAKQVSAIKKELKQEVEVKNIDMEQALATVDYNGTISTSLFAPLPGDGGGQRIGSQVTMTGAEFRYRVIGDPASSNTLRVILIRDKANVTTAVGDVLLSTLIGNGRAPLAFFDRDTRNHFEILYDKTHEFDYSAGNVQQLVKVNIPGKELVQFDDASGIVIKNAYRLITISNAAPAGAKPSFEGVFRFYYTDQ